MIDCSDLFLSKFHYEKHFRFYLSLAIKISDFNNQSDCENADCFW
jgi:hypothetical protein